MMNSETIGLKLIITHIQYNTLGTNFTKSLFQSPRGSRFSAKMRANGSKQFILHPRQIQPSGREDTVLDTVYRIRYTL